MKRPGFNYTPPPWPKKKLARLRKIEHDFHVRAFGEELARVNLDMTEAERHAYLAWMRQTARDHGIDLRAQSIHAWMDRLEEKIAKEESKNTP